jgi:hypothetical protein
MPSASDEQGVMKRFVEVAMRRLERGEATHSEVHMILVELFALMMQGERDLACALAERTMARWQAEAESVDYVILDDGSRVTRH